MNRKDFISTLTLSLSSIYANAFDKPVSAVLHTNRLCEKCKYNLGRNIVFEKGVRNVVVDVEKKLITIKYDSSKTNLAKLKKYIASIGFDADELKADMYKRERLRDCCLIDTTICK
jgi:periplasmic mercuric ion binding protein